jgi:hypothetical protein
LALGVVWPSFAIDAVSALAMSVIVLLCVVDDTVVPVTTGLPAGSE